MAAGEPAPGPASLVTWRDFERHEAREEAAVKALRDEVKDVSIRVDRIESIIDQMKGIRALVMIVFGTSVVTALIGVITLVALINGTKP